MARISDDELERLKRQVSVQRLAEGKGVQLKAHGKDLLGLCPFHDDREPSLVVTPEKNLWHCLGACQTGGSAIDWVMRAEGVSFRLAVELLRRDHPMLSEPTLPGAPPKRTTTVKLDELAEPDEPDHVVVGRVLSHYTATLKESPEALAYLQGRGLDHPELIERFQLGYANRTLGYRLPAANRKAGQALRSQLQRLGILRKTGHEHMSGSLVIPIFGQGGELSQLYGRKITPCLRSGTPQHLYLPRPHSAVWNIEALSHSEEVILCESLIDALTFWSAGFLHVITSYGVKGFTEAHLSALKAHGTRRVLIAYDRDEAGDKAAEALAPQLSELGCEVFRVVFPRGLDANAYAQKVKPADKALGTLLRAAKWMAGSRPVAVAAAVAQSDAARDAGEAEALETCDSAEEPEPVSPLAADSPAPPASAETSAGAELPDGEARFAFGSRSWRIRGLEKVSSLASLKLNVRVATETAFFTDSFDLQVARARAAFVRQAAEELELEERTVKQDLGRVLNALEARVEAQVKHTLQPASKTPALSDADKQAALALLKDPKLLRRIAEDFDRCGVVGERDNKLLGYLAAVSRKLEAPLAVVIQSSTAAGKTSLMDAILRFVPEEERVSYSAMTGQSLFYMGATDLSHKVLAIAEEEGATNAAYALKLLQSSGELTIASTGKDPQSGRLVTHEYQVRGPVMVMLTTTSHEVDEELLNRCLVLGVDEGREQTRAIQERQRQGRTLQGLLAKQHSRALMSLHQNAQRLLRPLHVVNPFAAELSFADHATRTRRDHMKYLTLIDAIALLHQYQRPIKTVAVGGASLRYIEVSKQDIAIADRLVSHVISRNLDELSPRTRQLLSQLGELVAAESKRQGIDPADFRFSRRLIRERLGYADTQLRVHLSRLVALEYVIVHRGKRGRSFVYELAASDEDEQSATTTQLRGGVAGGSRPLRGGPPRELSDSDSERLGKVAGSAQKHLGGNVAEIASYAKAAGAAE